MMTPAISSGFSAKTRSRSAMSPYSNSLVSSPHGLRHAAVVLDAPVAPAVVAAAGDLVAAGVGAHRADGRVGRVRAGLDEDGLLAARHDVGEPLLELVLQRLHEAEAEALVHLRLGGVVDLLLDVAEDDRPVGAEHVDVLVAVHVDDVAAVAVGDEDGVLADDEVVGAADTADAAGGEALGILEHRHGLGEVQFGGAFDGLRHVGSFRAREARADAACLRPPGGSRQAVATARSHPGSGQSRL